MKHTINSAPVCLATMLLAAVFATFLYADILDPRSAQWMLGEGDLLQHFLGWHFFRQEPWSWPLGAIHTYGTELESSIVFTDALPLLALPLKLMSSWLPEVFQYQGFAAWLHTILNALATSILLSRLRVNAVATVLVGLILAFLPAVMFRGPGAGGHESLMAHWIIMLGIYLLLFSPSVNAASCWRWCALLVVATLVHFYLFVMAGALWTLWWLLQTYNLYCRRICAPILWRYWLAYSAAQPLLIMLIMWTVGYLYSSGTGGGGYGFYSAELVAYFNPMTYLGDSLSFSSLISPWKPAIGGQYEGVAYVGVGIMALWLSALAALVWQFGRLRGGEKRETSASARGLAILCIGAFFYALGDPVTLAGHSVELPIGWPQPLRELLRATGRFNWLLMYSATLAALWLLSHRLRPAVFIALVTTVFALQMWDLGKWYDHIHDRNRQAGSYHSADDSRFQPWDDPVLQRALERKDALHVAPADNIVAALPIAWLAGMHDMSINVAYIARISAEDIEQAVAPVENALSRHKLKPDVVYAMTDNTWQTEICAMAAVSCRITPGATFAWRHDLP